jgi:branched-chain amino acid transport system substrate-binding protein
MAVEKAITADGIDFFIGMNRSEAAFAVMEVCADHKTIFVNGAASPLICDTVKNDYERYKYIFRDVPLSSEQVHSRLGLLHCHFAAAILKKELGIEKPKVAIFMEKLAWTEPMQEDAVKELPEMGLEVAGMWLVSSTATDVTAELLAIRDAGAHIIYQGMCGPVNVVFTKQWAGLEIPAVVVGTNGEAMLSTFWETTEGACNYASTWDVPLSVGVPATAKTLPFADEYKERYGEPPGSYSGIGSCGVESLVAGIELAGTTDPEAIIKALETHEVITVNGNYKWDKASHELSFGPGYVVYIGNQWRDGERVCVWPVEYEGCPEEWNFHFGGTVEFKIAPWVKEYWQGKS